MPRCAIATDAIAPPVGPFSLGIQAGEFLFLSGQVAQDPETGLLLRGDAAAQAEQIFKNVEILLHAAGKTLGDVVKVTVFLTDMREFAAVNAVYGRRFDQPYPARTTVAVAALPLGAAVEFDMVVR